MTIDRKKPEVLAREVWRAPLVDHVCDAVHLGHVQRLRRCSTGPSHAVYRVLTPRGVFAIRVGPAERAGEAWQRKTRFALLRVAPRHLHEDIAVLGRQVYRY